jgi:hypothetical protein
MGHKLEGSVGRPFCGDGAPDAHRARPVAVGVKAWWRSRGMWRWDLHGKAMGDDKHNEGEGNLKKGDGKQELTVITVC